MPAAVQATARALRRAEGAALTAGACPGRAPLVPRCVRGTLAALAFAVATAPACAETGATAGKTLHVALSAAPIGFDPAQVYDSASRAVIGGIFEAPLEYAFVDGGGRMRPNTAAAMPEISADFRTFTFHIRPGIRFADDPAFGGRPRELTAADYVYSIKRFFDPRWKSPVLFALETAKILGLSELRRRCLAEHRPFDYDAPVEGLRLLDRYSFQVRLGAPSPRFLYNFTDGASMGAVAREVVEAWGDRVSEHPVGTGPFVLRSARTSSRIELARNPLYREVRYDEQAPPGDAEAAAFVAALRGRRLPLVDRVVLAVIDAPQPRWLSFLEGEQDVDEAVPAEFAAMAFPGGRLAPHLAGRGVRMLRRLRDDVVLTCFAMQDPTVGGDAPPQVALRRAISLAFDVGREIRLLRGGQAIPAQSVIGPAGFGYDPRLKTELGDFDRARAQALLDLYGYRDRDGDGWRELPDGRPLRLRYTLPPGGTERALAELWQADLAAVGLRIDFDTVAALELSKAARAGRLMMWSQDWRAGVPDGEAFLDLGYGPNGGSANTSRFELPAFDVLYERQQILPDGPERAAVMAAAARMLVAYMPCKPRLHTVTTALVQPWVVGYRRNLFVREFWKYVDIDLARAPGRRSPSP